MRTGWRKIRPIMTELIQLFCTFSSAPGESLEVIDLKVSSAWCCPLISPVGLISWLIRAFTESGWRHGEFYEERGVDWSRWQESPRANGAYPLNTGSSWPSGPKGGEQHPVADSPSKWHGNTEADSPGAMSPKHCGVPNTDCQAENQICGTENTGGEIIIDLFKIFTPCVFF